MQQVRYRHSFTQLLIFYYIGVGTGGGGGGGQGGPGPPLFGELIYAYTAKSHDAETIRDVFCAIGAARGRVRAS